MPATPDKPRLTINFADFWQGFPDAQKFFLDLLEPNFDVSIGDKPDVLFYSVYSEEHKKYNCPKILFTGECVRPDFNECDYAFSFDYLDDERNYRLPLYALFGDVRELTKTRESAAVARARKPHFCCMLVSAPENKERIEFFHRLSLHAFVHSGGRYLNNIGGYVPREFHGTRGKLAYIKHFRFVMAFENRSYPGYTTEKIFDPMLVNSIPIYWGNPLIARDFNPNSFICAHDFNDLEDLARYVMEVNRDENLYDRYFEQPWFNGNQVNAYVKRENIIERLKQICSRYSRS